MLPCNKALCILPTSTLYTLGRKRNSIDTKPSVANMRRSGFHKLESDTNFCILLQKDNRVNATFRGKKPKKGKGEDQQALVLRWKYQFMPIPQVMSVPSFVTGSSSEKIKISRLKCSPNRYRTSIYKKANFTALLDRTYGQVFNSVLWNSLTLTIALAPWAFSDSYPSFSKYWLKECSSNMNLIFNPSSVTHNAILPAIRFNFTGLA